MQCPQVYRKGVRAKENEENRGRSRRFRIGGEFEGKKVSKRDRFRGGKHLEEGFVHSGSAHIFDCSSPFSGKVVPLYSTCK